MSTSCTNYTCIGFLSKYSAICKPFVLVKAQWRTLIMIYKYVPRTGRLVTVNSLVSQHCTRCRCQLYYNIGNCVAAICLPSMYKIMGQFKPIKRW